MKTETATEIFKMAPPGAVGGLNLFGVPIPEVVAALTLLYTVLLIVDKVRDMRRKWKEENGKSN